jgi:hypothetical protein
MHTLRSFILLCLTPVGASALTPAQAYHAAARFLRAEASAGFAASEAQAVLLGEAIGADALAAGPRSAALLASLELVSVDARARRSRALAALGLTVAADGSAVLAERTPGQGFGLTRTFRPTALDTALALQALDAAGLSATTQADEEAASDLAAGAPLAPTGGLWPLLRYPTDVGFEADLATTAQAVLALAPRQASHAAVFASAVAALEGAAPASVSERALRLLALLEASPAGRGPELQALAGLQNADGSFGSEPLAGDRVYATALVARTLLRADTAGYPFDSDGDGTADDPDPDSDGDGRCDPGQPDPSCTGTDAFPTDPAEWADLDKDGVGDNTDPDLDGDGIANGDDAYPTLAQERIDTDGDGTPDTADPDDDGDGLPDVDELLAGLDPTDVDTDGDHFRDGIELTKGRDPLDPTDVPYPDGDVFPLGGGDGLVDLRDELLMHRVLRGLVVVPPGDQAAFVAHADVAPLVGGVPAPNGGEIDAADVLIVTRRVRGMVAAW